MYSPITSLYDRLPIVPFFIYIAFEKVEQTFVKFCIGKFKENSSQLF